MSSAAAAASPSVFAPLRRPEFRRLLAISVTVALGFGMVIPTLPRFARSFGVGLATIGLIQVVFGSTRFGFGLVGGLVVDRAGERACTMAGLLIVAASSFAMGFSDTFPELVLARGFGGAGSALFIAGLQTRILRVIEPAEMGRATGAFRASFLVGIGIGPAVGGAVMAAAGARAVFHIYGAGLVLATLIAFFAMRTGGRGEPASRRSPLEALRAARPYFSDRRYVAALLATLVGWWTISGPIQTVGPVYGEDQLGLSAFQVGLAVTMLAVGEILALLVAGRAADVYGRRAVLVPSLLLTATSTALMGWIEPAPELFFPLMVAVGASIAAGGAAAGGLLADAVSKEGSGTAVGVNQMAGDLGFLLSPVLIGAAAEGAGYGTAYVVAAVPAAIVLFVALGLPRHRGPDEADAGVEPHPIG